MCCTFWVNFPATILASVTNISEVSVLTCGKIYTHCLEKSVYHTLAECVASQYVAAYENTNNCGAKRISLNNWMTCIVWKHTIPHHTHICVEQQHCVECVALLQRWCTVITVLCVLCLLQLTNFDNSCFMNSTVQLMSSSTYIRDTLASHLQNQWQQ